MRFSSARPLTSVSLCDAGKVLATACVDADAQTSTVALYDVATGAELRTFEHAHAVTAVALAGDASAVAVSLRVYSPMRAETVVVRAVATGAIRARFERLGRLSALDLSADGGTLLTTEHRQFDAHRVPLGAATVTVRAVDGAVTLLERTSEHAVTAAGLTTDGSTLQLVQTRRDDAFNPTSSAFGAEPVK